MWVQWSLHLHHLDITPPIKLGIRPLIVHVPYSYNSECILYQEAYRLGLQACATGTLRVTHYGATTAYRVCLCREQRVYHSSYTAACKYDGNIIPYSYQQVVTESGKCLLRVEQIIVIWFMGKTSISATEQYVCKLVISRWLNFMGSIFVFYFDH